ncbi:helix-turn-helix domain-containing protein [Clostridium sp. MCC353]|uniref:helix-turn-helix domain-containing protein n=1 Tax=Clostridium sp. MCC353 TaxID=2592646 RepID=UPI001C02FCC0|nr:helix-turn-helix domain-containing protein [Clostridium sp. MCC353]
MKTSYKKNFIIQFLISYILILTIPLLILSYGFQRAFEIVEKDIENSHISVLQNSVNIIESQLEEIQSLALQMSQNARIQEFAQFQKEDKQYVMPALKVIDEYYNMMHYQSIDLLGDHYLYFQGKDLILYQSTLYRPEIFEKYLNAWGSSLDGWKSKTVDPVRRIPGFQKSHDTIEYVMPFSQSLTGENQGVLVFRLKSAELKKILDFSRIYNADNYSIIICDRNNDLIWSFGDAIQYEDLNETAINGGYLKHNGTSIIQISSPKSGWNYSLAVPEKQALIKLSELKNFEFLLAGITLAVGILISLYLAFRKGKPINETIKIMSAFGKGPEKYSALGEVVTGILKDHQDLMEEAEQDKESVKKAFFHDLIKAEFASEQQILAKAQREGLLAEGTAYLVISFGIFQNDDFSQTDEQTLNEVRIISHLIQKQLVSRYGDKIWFYKWDYRDMVAILATLKTAEEERAEIGRIRENILREYRVETNWGISSVCDHLFYLWKAAEESRTALKHTDGENCILEYSIDLENKNQLYFPDIISDRLLTCIKTGNLVEIDEIIRFLEKENFEKRRWNRPVLIKFNRKVLELMSEFSGENDNANDWVLWLNEAVITSEGNVAEYFNRLRKICHQTGAGMAEKKNRQRKNMIDNIILYLHENYMDSGMGLAKIGAVFRISEGYLSSVFKEQTGTNFADYLEKIRIDQACELLKNEKMTINEIAQKVGYNSVQSFRRAFKRVKNMSPKEARN